ncbi:MAG: hypothetical protein M0Q46_05140 [Endomicrobiales bacterium]|nr:hypothetical protein [Endomicrobiales bacterium]
MALIQWKMEKIFCKRGHYRKNLFLGMPHFFVLLLLFGCCTLMFSLPANAAKKSKVNKAKATQVETKTPPAAQQPAKQSVPNVNPITQAAINAGVVACSSRINQIITYLVANSRSGAYLFFPKNQQNQSIFSTSIEVDRKDSTSFYASASFAPLSSGQAGGVYDSVEYVPQSCDYVEKIMFANLKRAGILKKNIRILDGGAVKVFLMPAGTGCIVIKKEVVQ